MVVLRCYLLFSILTFINNFPLGCQSAYRKKYVTGSPAPISTEIMSTSNEPNAMDSPNARKRERFLDYLYHTMWMDLLPFQ